MCIKSLLIGPVENMSKIEKLLIVTNKLTQTVKNSYNKSDEDIKKDLEILYEWWKKEQHLPFIKDDGILERTLMKNKFRIEQTKKKLDAYYTLKGMYSEFFNPSWEETVNSIETCFQASYFFPLPKATEDGQRLIIFKVKDPEKHDQFNMLDFFRYGLILLELMVKFDYCDSIRLLNDMEGFGFAFYKKMDPIILYKGMKLAQEGFSCRLSGFEYYNAPGFIDLVVSIMKPLIKDGRLKINKTLDDVFEAFPKELMPAEYGGTIGTLQELQDAWKEEIYCQKDFILERMQYKSDESKRIGQSKYDDMFGSEGTFKSINID